jgi:predicted O-methyltransferase YrrM
MKRIIKKISLFLVELGSPLTFFSAIWLKIVIRAGVGKIGDKIFMKLGILPVSDHYYQPMINPKKHLTKSLRDDRDLKGVDLNVDEQLKILSDFNYNEELLKFPLHKNNNIEYYYDNDSYGSGDAEYLYNIVRYFKPNRIIEIGSGFSTLMVRNAITQNKTDNSNYTCHHFCIEPYEQPWLEKTEVELIREKVECIEKSFFQKLESNDILFIDSSHIIRPQGDVLFEYLELLPALKSGVIIHVHDIFTPKDYPNEWIYDKHLLWNEQYLLEAFLTFNSGFRIIGALNYLTHNYRQDFADKCPVFAKQQCREPGAFWMIKK